MTDKEVEDGAGTKESGVATSGPKQSGLFGATGVQLTEDESASPVAVKFLRHINSLQEGDLQKLRSFEGQFYDKRQECEVLKKEKEGLEKEIGNKKTLENVQKVMITCGSVLLGALKLFEGAPWFVLLLMVLISVVLIIGGMFPVLRIGAAK